MGKVTFIKGYAGGYMALAWISLVLQLVLMIDHRLVSLPLTILRFFSFFTILSNLLAALSYTGIFLRSAAGGLKFFSSPAAFGAITLYMLVVGIVYNTILRSIWKPQGLQYVVNESLHLLLPLLALLGWFLVVPKTRLRWTIVFKWLYFPILYILLILVEGAFTGWYPYPFTDVTVIGYPRALLNGLVILIGMAILNLIFVVLARILAAARR
jgi:hypothetical protein